MHQKRFKVAIHNLLNDYGVDYQGIFRDLREKLEAGRAALLEQLAKG